MKILLVLAVAAVACNAIPHNSCTVGSWSDWSSCSSGKICPPVPVSLETYKMKPTSEWDEGSDAMTEVMKRKMADWDAKDACIAAGMCPEMLVRPTQGPHKCTAGMAADMPCKNVDQLAFLGFSDLGYIPLEPADISPRGNDVWGWTDPLNGDEYAIAGLSGATAFVRITDPENPVPLGVLYSRTDFSKWRDMKVIGHYVYIVAEAADHGLQVFDLTRLRGVTTLQVWTADAINSNFGQAHNIVANEDTKFIYVVGAGRNPQANYPLVCGGGLMIFDVSEPLNPTFAGCFGGDGYVHDAQCVIYHGPDARYTGRELCFCFNENSVTIVDVHDKSNMFIIAKTAYINVAYTHQGWLTEDHVLILHDDEQDEFKGSEDDPMLPYTKTYVWDISSLTDPILKSIFHSSETSIDHNQYIANDFAFQANYESGLRILHIDRETNELENVGYFDVLPSSTEVQFFGSWSVYPFFKSGYGPVLIESIDYGLFIVQPDWDAINLAVQSGKIHAEEKRTRPVLAATPGATCPPLVETKTCSEPVLC